MLGHFLDTFGIPKRDSKSRFWPLSAHKGPKNITALSDIERELEAKALELIREVGDAAMKSAAEKVKTGTLDNRDEIYLHAILG